MKDTDLTDILREAEQLACEGRLTQAAMLYRTLLADEDGLSPQVRASALNDLAVISAAGGDGEAARVYLRQALGCFPHHAQAQRNLHDLAAVAEHRPRPQEIFDCLTNLYASDEKARSHMEAHLQRYAEILSALGREAEGLKLLELGADTYFFLLLHQRYIPQEGLDEIMSELDAKMPALEAPPLKPASGEPVAVVFPESALAHQYCLGRGLEIGGSAHNPFGLDALNVDMTDSLETVFKQEEIRLCGRALAVDIVAQGDAIPLPDESQDFVVSSHVLEHFPNPIKALLEWDRLLRPGGVIFTIVPHKDRTFDHEKARTPLQHLIDDYVSGNKESHGDLNGHDHCWITEDVVELVRWMIENLGVQWEIIDVQDKDDKVGNGFTIVVRKQDSGINALLSRVMGSARCPREAPRGVAEATRVSHVPVPVVERAIRELSAERLSPKAALKVGELCFGAELHESAARFFGQALRADPGNAEAMTNLGVLCHRLGEMGPAREFFVRALAAAPESAEAQSNLARLPARA